MSSTHTEEKQFFGVIAEFNEADDLLNAAKRAREAGYQQMDAYSPFPVHGLSEVLGLDKKLNLVPYLVALGAIGGALAGYMLQYYTSVISYPLNIGGRPLHSWPAFMIVTFEAAVLGAASLGVFGMIALNKLPMPYHPVFETPNFDKVSRDKFFLCVFATDPNFDEERTASFMQTLGPNAVHAVEQGPESIKD